MSEKISKELRNTRFICFQFLACICFGWIFGFRSDFAFAAKTGTQSDVLVCAGVHVQPSRKPILGVNEEVATALAEFHFASEGERNLIETALGALLSARLSDQSLSNDQIALARKALLDQISKLPLVEGDSIEGCIERVSDVFHFVLSDLMANRSTGASSVQV
jgi:hypothetical protein